MAQQELIPFDDDMKLPAALAALGSDEDWGSGIVGGFPVISLEGKRFTIMRGDTSELITRPDDPDEPAGSIEVVILRTHKGVAKTYYVKKYTPGSAEKPDCYSNDGVTPAADAENPQARACATCPHNQWGSRITEEGKKAKSCSDVKRLAVATADQLDDPMLLRLPATSLKIWDQYVGMLNKKGGIKPAQVVTKIAFDKDVTHQQFTFKPVALINASMAAQVASVREDPVVLNIIGSGPDAGSPESEQPAPALPVMEDKPAAKPAPKVVAAKEEPKPAAKAPEVDLDSIDADLDDMLGDLGFDDDES